MDFIRDKCSYAWSDALQAVINHCYPITSASRAMVTQKVLVSNVHMGSGIDSSHDLTAQIFAPKVDDVLIDFFDVFIGHFY